MKACSVKFIIVIKNHKIEWLPPIQIKLQKELRKLTNIWKITVVVLNREQALSYHLIVE